MSESIIALLEDVLEKADEGKITGLAIVTLSGQSNINAYFRDMDRDEAAAATAFLGHLTAKQFYNVTDDETAKSN